MCLFIGNKCYFIKAMEIASSQPSASLRILQGPSLLLRWCWKCHPLGLRTRKLCWRQRPILYCVHIYLSNLIPKSALSVQPKLSCILTSLKPSSSVSVAISSSLYSADFWDLHSKVPFSFSFLSEAFPALLDLLMMWALFLESVNQKHFLSACIHYLREISCVCNGGAFLSESLCFFDRIDFLKR